MRPIEFSRNDKNLELGQGIAASTTISQLKPAIMPKGHHSSPTERLKFKTEASHPHSTKQRHARD